MDKKLDWLDTIEAEMGAIMNSGQEDWPQEALGSLSCLRSLIAEGNIKDALQEAAYLGCACAHVHMFAGFDSWLSRIESFRPSRPSSGESAEAAGEADDKPEDQ